MIMPGSRLANALRRQQRASRRPAVSARAAEVGLAHSFLPHEEQETLIEAFRQTAERRQTPWLDFSAIADAAPWIQNQVSRMPPLCVAIPGGDLDSEPALAADPRALLGLVMNDPTFLSIDGCLLLASDGTASLEVFPNHTHGGDVISVHPSGQTE